VKAKLADGGAGLPAWWLLALICTGAAVLLAILGGRLTFFNDEWYIVLQRPGFDVDAILEPHNEHLIALVVVAYKGLIAVFGLESQLPQHLLLVCAVIALGIVVFVYVRERAGNLLALLAAAVLLFLGPGWEDLLWPFQVGFTGSLAAGVGMLLAIERDSLRRNLIATLLLLLAISISDLGIAFLVAAAIAVLLRGRTSQLWIPGIPSVLFAAWWLAYGSDASSNLSLTNIARLPVYVLDSISSGLASIAGLAHPLADPATAFPWGRLLLVLAIVGTAAWLLRGGKPSPGVLVVAGAALTFWLLAGASYIPGREPQVSRYQLVSSTFLILIAAELFRPVRIGSAGLGAISAIALVAIGSNLEELRTGYTFLRSRSANAKAALGGLEIGRGRFPAELRLVEAISPDSHLAGITAGSYYRETEAHGALPFYSPDQISAAPPELRQAVDKILVVGYAVRLAKAPRGIEGAVCRHPEPRLDGAPRDLVLPSGETLIVNRGAGPVDLGVRRFAPPPLPVMVGTLGVDHAATLRIPADSAGLPWHLSLRGASLVEACRLTRLRRAS